MSLQPRRIALGIGLAAWIGALPWCSELSGSSHIVLYERDGRPLLLDSRLRLGEMESQDQIVPADAESPVVLTLAALASFEVAGRCLLPVAKSRAALANLEGLRCALLEVRRQRSKLRTELTACLPGTSLAPLGTPTSRDRWSGLRMARFLETQSYCLQARRRPLPSTGPPRSQPATRPTPQPTGLPGLAESSDEVLTTLLPAACQSAGAAGNGVGERLAASCRELAATHRTLAELKLGLLRLLPSSHLQMLRHASRRNLDTSQPEALVAYLMRQALARQGVPELTR